ncbi:MAG: hypothetical protein V1849_03480 [Chloroflexota bacterium]
MVTSPPDPLSVNGEGDTKFIRGGYLSLLDLKVLLPLKEKTGKGYYRRLTMANKFRITVGSDTEFEDLIAYLYHDEDLIGIISQEEGFANLRIHLPIGIEFPIRIPYKEMLTLNLRELEDAIKKAKERLWELRRIEPPETKVEATAAEKNALGQKIVDEILNNPGTTKTLYKDGGLDVREPDGRGIRYRSDGASWDFRGFLEP